MIKVSSGGLQREQNKVFVLWNMNGDNKNKRNKRRGGCYCSCLATKKKHYWEL